MQLVYKVTYIYQKGSIKLSLGHHIVSIYKTLHFDATSGIGFGDMNYNRARGYTDGTGGSSYDKYYKKNESIHYHNYRAYFSPSFLFLFNGKMKLFLGARISYINFSHFDYTFKNEQSGYGPEVIIENISIQKRNIEKLNIEPHISFHIPYKKVGFFCQAMYYGPLGTNINVNNYNIMSRATIPVLISMGITINPNFSKSN
ncbi:MAG: hypothetical protein IPH32_01200 [Bacteroidetes bacterium]|nr:hypothetical protein [Bacteroidota bacterium]